MNYDIDYNRAAIRELINRSLIQKQLRDLCFDHFPEVYDESQDRAELIRSLLDYADRQYKIDQLLQEIQRINPVQYSLFKNRLINKPTANQGAPSSIGIKPVSDTHLTWLHLSDIHFGHGKEARHRIDQKVICDEIIRDVQEVEEHLGPPDFVFITGDIAFKGSPVEYSQAAEWIDNLLTTVSVGRDRVYMVPGNHDVDRKKAVASVNAKTNHDDLRSNPAKLDELLEKPRKVTPIWSKLKAYAEFAASYAAPKLTATKPFWTYKRSTRLGEVIIVGLNTNLLSFDDNDSPANLALGMEQLRQAIHNQPRDALLLVIQHHPPHWLTDKQLLEGMLRDRPHILFCGHVHEQGGLLSSPLHGGQWLELVAGAGHTDPKEPPEHAYAWGRLNPAGLEYFPRTWSRQRFRFVADKNNFQAMKDDGAVPITCDRLPAALRNWLSIIHTP